VVLVPASLWGWAAGAQSDTSADMSGYFGAQFTTNERWTDEDERDIGVDLLRDALRWEGEIGSASDQLAQANEVGAVRPKLQTYHQDLNDYRRKRALCEEDHQSYDEGGNRLCYPEVGIQLISGILPGCVSLDQFLGLRYGRFCGAGFPTGHAFNTHFIEPIDGVDYCCRLHDWSLWGYGLGLNEEFVDACGMAMCLSQASGFPANIVELMPDVEDARRCWYDFATDLCPDIQEPLPPLGPPSP